MHSQKEFKENLEAVSAIKTITSIYQEIAAIRMKQLKDRVAKTREFLDGVAEIYNHGKAAYIAMLQAEAFKGKKDWRELKFIKRNGKNVLVFLSANEHLYGNLILDVWQQFQNDVIKTRQDAVVVGSFGKYLVKNEARIDSKIDYFDLGDDKPKPEQINKILSYIRKYEQIFIYYGQLVTVLNQIPMKEQISGGVTFEQKGIGKRYLFEPTPQNIMEFFETEIINALFNQKIYEHQLARFSSRMVAMDQATENANEILKKLEKDFITLKRRLSNRKQLEIFAGYSIWGEETK